jgi:hypothetical protein
VSSQAIPVAQYANAIVIVKYFSPYSQHKRKSPMRPQGGINQIIYMNKWSCHYLSTSTILYVLPRSFTYCPCSVPGLRGDLVRGLHVYSPLVEGQSSIHAPQRGLLAAARSSLRGGPARVVRQGQGVGHERVVNRRPGSIPSAGLHGTIRDLGGSGVCCHPHHPYPYLPGSLQSPIGSPQVIASDEVVNNVQCP